jgi:hypothetical protein
MTNTSYTTTETYTTDSGELRSYDVLHITLPVTIKNETRDIEFRQVVTSDGIHFLHAKDVVACQIGRGEKRHASSLVACVWKSADEAKSRGWNADQIHTVGDMILTVNTRTTSVRNRQAIITDWRDNVAGTAQATAQNYYGSL